MKVNLNLKNLNKNEKAFAIVYIMFIVFIVFMLALALVNVVEKTAGYTKSKERMAQRWEALNVGTNLGWSYLTHLINSTPSVLPDTNRLIQDGYRNGRLISNFNNNVNIRVYIFDRDIIDYYWGNSNGLDNFINDLRRGISEVIQHDNTTPLEGSPYLVLTEVENRYRLGGGNRIYQLAIFDLENFNRFAYFTNIEETPSGSSIWFLAGIDRLFGPVHTNSPVVRIAQYNNFYTSSTFNGDYVFNGPFSFRGNLTVNSNTNPPNGFIVNPSGVSSEVFFQRTFANGINSVQANSPEVKLPPDDPNDSRNTLRQVWPPLQSPGGGSSVPTSQRGIFVYVDNNKITSGIYVRDTDTNNILNSLDLQVAEQNGQVFPKYKFQFDNSGTYSTPITLVKKDKEAIYTIDKPPSVTTLKVKEYNLSTGGSGSRNLLDILNQTSGYQTVGNSYSVNANEKVLIATKIEGNTMYVTKFILPDRQTFPQNAIWVNGSIGEELGATNKVGGLSGVAAEPITIIAKSSNQASATQIKSIRIKGSIIPYGVNPGYGNLPDYNNNIVIGLYSDIIFVGKNAQLYTDLGGNNNGIYIYASILAMKDRPGNSNANYTSNQRGGYFMVENYDSWSYNSNNILHVYGGILQYFRGPVGTFNSSTGSPYTGFKKDYRYDLRFSYLKPPLFPTTTRYVNRIKLNISFNL